VLVNSRAKSVQVHQETHFLVSTSNSEACFLLNRVPYHDRYKEKKQESMLVASWSALDVGWTHRMRDGFGSLREYPRYRIKGRYP
jgi:hypothetical protein